MLNVRKHSVIVNHALIVIWSARGSKNLFHHWLCKLMKVHVKNFTPINNYSKHQNYWFHALNA